MRHIPAPLELEDEVVVLDLDAYALVLAPDPDLPEPRDLGGVIEIENAEVVVFETATRSDFRCPMVAASTLRDILDGISR